jgi:hypothetical protein
VPTDKKKETRKRASKQVLGAEPGPTAAAYKKVKADALVVSAAVPTPGAWCPIHETNSHDFKTYRTVYGLTRSCKKCFMERRAIGNVGNCYNYSHPGHLARDCPGKFPGGGGIGSRGGGHAVGEDMAAAVAIRPGNLIAILPWPTVK